jgi:hypothetical protein
LNVDGSHIAIREIHGTRKCKRRPAALRIRPGISNHPVVAARPVVDANPFNADISVAIARDSFLDGSLAGVDSPVGGISHVDSTPPAPVAVEPLDLGVKNSAVVEIDGTRESKRLIASIPSQIENAVDGIARPRIIVGLEPAKSDIAHSKALHSLLPDSVLTGPHGVALWKSPPVAAVALVALGSSASPDDVEGIDARTIFGILDLHSRSSAAVRIADKTLAPAPIDSGKPESRRIVGHRPGTFKTTPLGRRAAQISQCGCVAPDINFRPSIHKNLDSALAAVPVSPADHRCPALLILRR